MAAAFWLLVAAWFCANIPSAAVSALGRWLADGSHFSHQQRLTVNVAELLVGTPAPVTIAESEPRPAPPPAPAVPADPTFKKLEVPLARGMPVVAAPAFRELHALIMTPSFGTDRAAPPHQPPRAARIS